jgi:hypothetical protein
MHRIFIRRTWHRVVCLCFLLSRGGIGRPPQRRETILKKILCFSLLTLLVLVGNLSATPVACTTTPPVTVATVSDTYMTPPTGSPTIDCGPLVFSNFQAVNAGGAAVGTAFNFVSPGTWDAATGIVLLSFNPNFSVASAPGMEDIHLFFDVTAAAGFNIIGVDGSIGGTNSHYTEYVCAGAGGYSGSGLCSSATLASFSVFSPGGVQAPLTFAPQGSVGIFKDIQTAGPGALTSFGQSFEVSGVPEPATLAMFGGGLLLFALARRKRA